MMKVIRVAYEADKMGLTGSERDAYVMESAAIGAISFGVGRVALKIGNKALRSSKKIRNNFSKKSKVFKIVSVKLTEDAPSIFTDRLLNDAKESFWNRKKAK